MLTNSKSLELGMLADAIVLEADPFETPDAIDEIAVAKTIVGGTVVYSAD